MQAPGLRDCTHVAAFCCRHGACASYSWPARGLPHGARPGFGFTTALERPDKEAVHLHSTHQSTPATRCLVQSRREKNGAHGTGRPGGLAADAVSPGHRGHPDLPLCIHTWPRSREALGTLCVHCVHCGAGSNPVSWGTIVSLADSAGLRIQSTPPRPVRSTPDLPGETGLEAESVSHRRFFGFFAASSQACQARRPVFVAGRGPRTVSEAEGSGQPVALRGAAGDVAAMSRRPHRPRAPARSLSRAERQGCLFKLAQYRPDRPGRA